MVSSSGRWCMTSIHSTLCSHLYSPLLFWHSQPPQCPFPIYAFYANSTEGNDAVRVHFIGVLMISLFFFPSFWFLVCSNAENWFCACPSLYSGKLCQFTACERNPCARGATCVPQTQLEAACLCPYGRQGLLCDEGRSYQGLSVDRDLHQYPLRRDEAGMARGCFFWYLCHSEVCFIPSPVHTSVFEVRPIGGVLKCIPSSFV